MKKIIILICILTEVCLFSNDFRGLNFGDSMETVKKAEKCELASQDKTMLVYQDKISGIKMYVMYNFENNKLMSGGYLCSENYSNSNDYVKSYFSLKDILIAKYGNPSGVNENVESIYKDDPEYYGLALSTGRARFTCKWDLPNMTILCGAIGNNLDCDLMINYTSKEYNQLIEEREEENNNKNL